MKEKNKDSFILNIKVIPKANCNEIIGWEQEELKIRLKAVPEKGEANATLIAFLAAFLKIAKSNIELVSGATSRHKRLKIHALNENDVMQKLNLINTNK